MGKFSGRQIDIFLFFSQKIGFGISRKFDILMQIAWNVESDFLRKIGKIF